MTSGFSAPSPERPTCLERPFNQMVVEQTTARIEPGSPWENGFSEAFNGHFSDESLNTELFITAPDVQILAGPASMHRCKGGGLLCQF